jgi:tetratricopeptide (TPR) repeat protein
MRSPKPSNPAFRAPNTPSSTPPSSGVLRSGSSPAVRAPVAPPFRPSAIPGTRPSTPAFRASSQSRASLPAVTADTLADLTGTATAEKAFEAARIQLRRGALEEAFTLAERACSAEPEQPQYRALHAWLRVQRGELQAGPVADEILTILTWAARQRRTDLEIRMYRGRVLQRLGRHDEAIREFSVVASMDEKNIEAIREVRLHRAREESRAATSGMFAKLFKPGG